MTSNANISAIQATLEALEQDADLSEPNNFARRADAIDWLEFHLIDNQDPTIDELKLRAAQLQTRFRKIDQALLARLRGEIKVGKLNGAHLREVLCQSAGAGDSEFAGYDALDVLVAGVLELCQPPQETLPREAEMVFYQPTPARIVLALIDAAKISAQDVFYDLGSGLGQVCFLVNLLTGAKTIGVEYEPAFCDSARQSASNLNLKNIEFINRDARTLDYTDGTVFFLYTPFKGKMLQTVLRKLETQQRQIRVGTFGSCTPVVAQQWWLKPITQKFSGDYEFAVFDSR